MSTPAHQSGVPSTAPRRNPGTMSPPLPPPHNHHTTQSHAAPIHQQSRGGTRNPAQRARRDQQPLQQPSPASAAAGNTPRGEGGGDTAITAAPSPHPSHGAGETSLSPGTPLHPLPIPPAEKEERSEEGGEESEGWMRPILEKQDFLRAAAFNRRHRDAPASRSSRVKTQKDHHNEKEAH